MGRKALTKEEGKKPRQYGRNQPVEAHGKIGWSVKSSWIGLVADGRAGEGKRS